MRRIIVSILIAMSLGSAAATPAAAEKVTIRVPYGDLDLAQPAGIATLRSRIEAAAKKACADLEASDVYEGSVRTPCLRALRTAATVKIAQVASGPALAESTIGKQG